MRGYDVVLSITRYHSHHACRCNHSLGYRHLIDQVTTVDEDFRPRMVARVLAQEQQYLTRMLLWLGELRKSGRYGRLISRPV
jgi:hypothetical protein